MNTAEYNHAIRKLSWPYGAVMFGTMIPGFFAALFLTDRLAASSSWERQYVFLSMFPMLIAPILIACLLTELLDGKIGLKCSCGQTLSFGKHVRTLMQQGGSCPRCGKEVVEREPEQNNPSEPISKPAPVPGVASEKAQR